MSFKAELLVALESEFDVTPKTVASGIAQVIRGQTVVENQDGAGNLISKRVTTTPKDILNGAMIYDALRGGDLGLAPRQLRGATGTAAVPTVHKRLEIDSRIIANEDEGMMQNTLLVVKEAE